MQKPVLLIKIIGPYLILLFLCFNTVADIRTSNSYFTNGGNVREKVTLHNMDYINEVSISDYSVFAESTGRQYDPIRPSYFEDQLIVGSFGANFQLDGKKLTFARNFATGTNNFIDFSHSFASGKLKSKLFNRITSLDTFINANNVNYQANYGVSPEWSYMDGFGGTDEDLQSGFEHNIELTHMGKPCKMESYLLTGAERIGNMPVSYRWESYEGSDAEYAETGTRITAFDGNRGVDLGITGKSKVLSDKYAGPEHLDPIDLERYNQVLFMNFEIN